MGVTTSTTCSAGSHSQCHTTPQQLAGASRVRTFFMEPTSMRLQEPAYFTRRSSIDKLCEASAQATKPSKLTRHLSFVDVVAAESSLEISKVGRQLSRSLIPDKDARLA